MSFDLKAWGKAYRSTPEYKAKAREKSRIWRLKNKAKHLAMNADWARRNPEKVRAQKRRFRQRHADWFRTYRLTRYMTGKDAATRAAWREKNRDKVRAQARRHQRRYPEKTRARMAVNNAVHRGLIVRPDRCQGCGHPGKIEAHHDDYSRPLDVRWLCFICHKATHGARVRELEHNHPAARAA